jgi:hypothetical protein
MQFCGKLGSFPTWTERRAVIWSNGLKNFQLLSKFWSACEPKGSGVWTRKKRLQSRTSGSSSCFIVWPLALWTESLHWPTNCGDRGNVYGCAQNLITRKNLPAARQHLAWLFPPITKLFWIFRSGSTAFFKWIFLFIQKANKLNGTLYFELILRHEKIMHILKKFKQDSYPGKVGNFPCIKTSVYNRGGIYANFFKNFSFKKCIF